MSALREGAMNAGAGRLAMGKVALAPRQETRPRTFQNPVRLRHAAVLAALLVFPWVTSPFVTFQIGAQSLALGLIALSLTFLGGYGGMISLAQMTVAGIAGYMVGIFGTSGTAEISLGWPWWIVVTLALAIATLAGTFIGWLSVRTEGIYTIHDHRRSASRSTISAFRTTRCSTGSRASSRCIRRSSSGELARPCLSTTSCCSGRWRATASSNICCARRSGSRCRAFTRQPPPHERARVPRHSAPRCGLCRGGFIAAVGGVLLVWYNGLITPNSAGTSWLINILIIAVLGGMRHPIGPFIGAIVFVLLQTFAIDLIDRERFNLVIGGVFLAIVLFSPDGLLGLWAALQARLTGRSGSSTPGGGNK
jgi:branched-chain amino acid transport system permease protein